MKKKNLIILLLIPFLIALLGVMTIEGTFSLIENDILSIEWEYEDVEGFKIQDGMYQLKATGLNLKNYPAGSGNNLVWSIENKDGSDELYAEIIEENGKVYLKAIKAGEVIITCSNEKGNVTKKMTAVIYENGVIIVKPKIQSSQNNIDSKIYYGEYDLVNNEKKKATIELDINVIPNSLAPLVKVLNQTDNIEVDLTNKKISILEEGEVNLEVGCNDSSLASSSSLDFVVVKDGINVYTYQDLLYCTNKSEKGEIAVLRKSFESFDINSSSTANNMECFGKYNSVSKKFDFSKDVYRFETTYNQEYIAQWNEFAKNNSNYKPITNEVIAALHIQKDFYGNGYSLNFHNLTYPSGSPQEIIGSDGSKTLVPTLADSDLFRGPLSFYTLGDPNNLPLITAYGQDNVGMYIDGDNILVNDVNVRNCDFGNNLKNLDTVGNVAEIYGNNITIKNSHFKNGKNVIRCFSSKDVLIDNSLLEYSRNFLLYLGTNEYIKIDDNSLNNFIDLDGKPTVSSIKDFLAYQATGDKLLNNYLLGSEDYTSMYNSITSIQNALNNSTIVKDKYKSTITINDTLFYKSGISSISIDTLFNGPYLYSNSPSLIGDIFDMVGDLADSPIIPFEPVNVSGLSYPIKVDLTGDTKFYDYKTIDELDLSGLIGENISVIANSLELYEGTITIDDIFPLKELLFKKASSYGQAYVDNGSRYINLALAYYGGGLNLSKVSTLDLNCKNEIGSTLSVDLLDNYLGMTTGEGTIQMMKSIMLKSVTVVIGFEPFKFMCFEGNGYLFNETPKVSDLQNNAKGV